MNSDIIYSDATKLAELIRTREVSPIEIVQAHLDRIEAVNQKLNAIVAFADNILEAARAAEAAVLAGDQLGPLHGVPFTAKDSIDTAGVLTQRGSPIFKGRVPDTDATSVARMKKAGGILLAKTNLPEFSYWIESDNLLTGRSNNPWDLERTPLDPPGVRLDAPRPFQRSQPSSWNCRATRRSSSLMPRRGLGDSASVANVHGLSHRQPRKLPCGRNLRNFL
jgi:hypothetical protein